MGGETAVLLGSLFGALALGCASAPPPPEPAPTVVEPPKAEPEAAAPEASMPEEPAPASTAEPEFRPGMTVAEAVAAVPADLPRLNIEPEVLAAPISDPELYAPCQLKASEHFRLEVAIWNGRAVGVDVDLKPKNEARAECVRKQVESVTWKARAKSLNTVRFQF